MKKYLLILFILILPTFSLLLRPGYFPMQDNMQVFRVYQMRRCLDNFQLPCRWVPDMGFGYGYPLFLYYAPGPYYLGAVLSYFTQYHDAVKIIFVGGFLLSGLSMFVFAYEIFQNKYSALASAILYIYLPVRAVQVYVRGSLSEFLSFIFFPLIFLYYYRLIKTGSKASLVLSALSLSGLILTHNLMSYLFLPLTLIWITVQLFVQRQFGRLPKVLIAFLLGTGLAAFFVLPVVFERGYVHLETLIGGYFGYQQHFVSLYRLFLSHAWGYGSSAIDPPNQLSLSVGQLQWLLALVSMVFSLISLKKMPRLAVPIVIFSLFELFILFLMHVKSGFIWAALPLLAFLQFPWRLLTISGFITAYIAGWVVNKKIFAVLTIAACMILYGSFFRPKSWFSYQNSDLFTPVEFLRQQTTSIYDYLPVSAVRAPNTASSGRPLFLSGMGLVGKYTIESARQFGALTVVSPLARVELPVYDFPGMQVLVDHQLVSHTHSYFGLIGIELASGHHDIQVNFTDIPDRLAGDIISVLSLFAVSLFILI